MNFRRALIDIDCGTCKQVFDKVGRGICLARENDSSIYLAAQNPPAIYHSSDNGSRWSLVFDFEKLIGNRTHVCGLTAFKKSGTIGFLITCSDHAHILQSFDRGQTWKTVADTLHKSAEEIPCCLKGSKVGEYYVCLCDNGEHFPCKSILISFDFGATWIAELSPRNLWC